VVNTIVATSSDTAVVAPSTLTDEVTPPTLTSAVAPSVDVVVHTTGDPTGGAVSITGSGIAATGTAGANGHAIIALPKLNGGTYTAIISYAGTASSAAASKSITLSVAKAPVSLTWTIAPAQPTIADQPKVTVTVTSGAATSGLVSIKASTFTVSAQVVNGKAVITLPKTPAGNHPMTISYAGNASTLPATRAIVVSVAKVASTISYVTNPTTVKALITTATMTVTVKAPGAVVDGVVIKLNGVSEGTVKNGKVTFKLPRLGKGAHNWTLAYGGTSTAAASTKSFTLTVH
jgi:hypothetical protein